ncbi:ribosomal protein S5 domain 2-like protein [Meredithblackwellia eburnea MCA 4105]
MATSRGSRGVQTIQRAAQPFFPTSATPSASQPVRVTTKPPSSLWYTARPSLNETIVLLDKSLSSVRKHLFDQGILSSIYQTLPSNHPLLPHPRQRRWKDSRAMAAYLKNGTELRMNQYKKLTGLLSGLEGLIPYAKVVDERTGGQGWDGQGPGHQVQLVLNPVERALALSSSSSSANSLATPPSLPTISSQIEYLLSNFQQRTSSSPLSSTDDQGAVERISGKARRLGQKDSHGRVRAVGRRKESSAQVWIIPSTPSEGEGEGEGPIPGRVLINSHPLPTYFTQPAQQDSLLLPLKLTESLTGFNVFVIVKGGGLAAQAEASAMGLARALAEWERCEVEEGKLIEGTEEWYDILKKAKLLSRDPRVVERKKTGQPKARKKNTWVKR